MDMTVKVPVMSRNGGNVFYNIPEENINRIFTPGEVKMISLEELQKLEYTPGGEYLLKNSLVINNKEALGELNLEVEPEYFYTPDIIHKVLFDGSLDEVEDMLNFAPSGVIDIIQQIAVRDELPDTRKRKLILDKTNFNVSGALEVKEILKDENDDAAAAVNEKPKRKAKPATDDTPKRKAKPAEINFEAPKKGAKYSVVSKG